MVKPTAPCQKRLERRLRGFRSQAIRILRKAIASVNHAGCTDTIVQSPDAKRLSISHNRLDTPPGYPSGHNLGLYSRGSPGRSSPDIATIRDAVSHHPVVPATSLPSYTSYLDSKTARESHSVYKYNKAAIPLLPVLSLHLSKLLRAYFNMIPQGSRLRASSSSYPPTFFLSLSRAFVSDRAADKTHIKPDLIGKLSIRKNGFWRPFRRLLERQARIQFKHYQSSVGIHLSVYDRRLEVARQRLRYLESRLGKSIRAEACYEGPSHPARNPKRTESHPTSQIHFASERHL
jgi:hypothetical protein